MDQQPFNKTPYRIAYITGGTIACFSFVMFAIPLGPRPLWIALMVAGAATYIITVFIGARKARAWLRNQTLK